MSIKLTEQDFIEAARILNCEVAVIKAVTEVESAGSGFLPDGQPKILYEPFVFGRLTGHKWNGKTVIINNIQYPLSLQGKWSVKAAKYGSSSIQHLKLQAAVKLDRDNALKSCSWGLFQVMAHNYKLAGFSTLQDFINANYKSEGSQLLCFINFVKNSRLDDELREKRFRDFAISYNGRGYHKNTPQIQDDYDYLIMQAYKKYKKLEGK